MICIDIVYSCTTVGYLTIDAEWETVYVSTRIATQSQNISESSIFVFNFIQNEFPILLCIYLHIFTFLWMKWRQNRLMICQHRKCPLETITYALIGLEVLKRIDSDGEDNDNAQS